MNKATFSGGWGFRNYAGPTHFNFVQYRFIRMLDGSYVKFMVTLNVRKPKNY